MRGRVRVYNISWGLNQKLKLMVRSVDATQTLLIAGTKYSTLNEGWLRFELVTSCHIDSDTMSRNQLNQKLKLMVEAPGYVIYSNTPPHTRALWTRSVDATQALLIAGTKYSTLNERWVVEIRTSDLLSHWL